MFVDNANEREKAQQLCSEHIERGNKILEEYSTTIERTIPRLKNSAFEDETLLQSFPLPSSILFWRSKFSKSKSSSGSSYKSKQSIVETQLLAEQEHVKTERKLQRLTTV